MLVIDGHLDLAWNALNWNRDITLPVADIRRAEAGSQEAHRGANTVSLPEMRKAEVGVCLATLLARASTLGEPLLDYPSRGIASAMARGQLAYYRILEAQGQVRMIGDWASLAAQAQAWGAHMEGREQKAGGSDREPENRNSKFENRNPKTEHRHHAPATTHQAPGTSHCPLGFILSMEGADPILSPSQVAEWWKEGLRVVGPVHYGASSYAHGTGASGGLTSLGRDLLKAMDEVGMVLDVTHMADESLWQALDLFRGPVLASHHNCRALVPGDRQLSDEQIRRLIERGAVIGAAFDSWMLYPGYVFGETPNSLVSMERVADHLDHVCQLAGNVRHAALGTDLDGGFGREQTPHDLDTIADVQNLPGILRKRGYREADVEAVMHGNWLRFFRKAWTTRTVASA
jgi:membrane dipeptidase